MYTPENSATISTPPARLEGRPSMSDALPSFYPATSSTQLDTLPGSTHCSQFYCTERIEPSSFMESERPGIFDVCLVWDSAVVSLPKSGCERDYRDNPKSCLLLVW